MGAEDGDMPPDRHGGNLLHAPAACFNGSDPHMWPDMMATLPHIRCRALSGPLLTRTLPRAEASAC